MRVIISPAKKMRTDPECMPYAELPALLSKAEQICSVLQSMTGEELKKLWKCNDEIAELNMKRLRDMDLRSNLTPAILAYEGIQYRYMAPGVFTDSEFAYIKEHLRILSGFYGILRPFDGVSPYRLEMQAKLRIGESKDLYGFWGGSIAETLISESDCVINLASKEYSDAVLRFLPKSVQFVSCVFGQKVNGKIVEKGTLCKMARGEMVRYMAQTQAQCPEDLKCFDRIGYRYYPEYSDDATLCFLRDVSKE